MTHFTHTLGTVHILFTSYDKVHTHFETVHTQFGTVHTLFTKYDRVHTHFDIIDAHFGTVYTLFTGNNTL